MDHLQGKKRIVIENIKPSVSCGKYPAKRVVNERVTVTADIFTDGHDEVSAVLLYHKEGAEQWQEVPMKLVVNDRWEASFTPSELGTYEIKIQGWVNHFSTWQHGLKKKFEANQDIKTELLIGAGYMDKAAGTTPDEPKTKLTEWKNLLESTGRSDNGSESGAVSYALSEEASGIMFRYAPRENMSESSPLSIKVERQKALFSSWYELFPRSAADEPGRHGTFKDVEKRLPRIKSMGFDVLYMPPIHPIGQNHRKGKNNTLNAGPDDVGSPWAIGGPEGGHKSIHPELGTMDDFTSLVNAAKEQGIEIALDIAYQCSPDHPYVKEHPEWFKWRPDGTVQYAENPPKKYQDILPLNFETEDWQNLWQELKSIVDFWIDKGVMIFRVDNPHTKAFPFWEWMIAEVKKEHPEVIFLSEAFTKPRVMERLAKLGFDQSYTYFTWRTEAWEIKEYLNEITQTEVREYFRPNFWPNTPDINPWHLQSGAEQAFILRVLLAGTLSSNYGLYGPVYEFGVHEPVENKEEYLNSEKYEIKNWDWHKETRIMEIITRLNLIRRENPALQDTYNLHFAESTNEQIICFGKVNEQKDNTIIVAANLDNWNTQGAHVRLPLEKLGIREDMPYLVKDLMSGSKYRWYGDFNYVQLNPYQMPVHIFKVEQTSL